MTTKAHNSELSAPPPLRVLSMNVWGFSEPYEARLKLLREGVIELEPDLMAFQEAGLDGERNQVADLLDEFDYQIIHQFDVEDKRQGNNANCIASRWPVEAVEVLSLRVTDHCKSYPYAALAVRVDAPAPIGQFLFVNAKPSWELNREYERELQAVAVARMIERLANRKNFPTLLCGDFDASPDSASIRFLTGRQSLSGMSVHYLDAWEQAGDGSQGLTWTYENEYARAIIERAIRQTRHARRIDYIFLGSPHEYPRFARFRDCRVALNQAAHGIWPSDHYAVFAEIDISE